MKKLIGICAALTMLAPTLSFAVGAIAVDDQVGDQSAGYGIVTGAGSKDEAKAGALKKCKEAGNDNCKFAVWFETCGAYAASEKYAGVGWGADEGKAKAMAMQKCGDSSCKVVASECE